MIRRRVGLKNPMIFVFFRLTSSLNEITDYDLIGASFLKRYFFTLSSIAKHFTRLAPTCRPKCSGQFMVQAANLWFKVHDEKN